MKILSASQTRALDQYTIENEPISSLNLMERASMAFCEKFLQIFSQKQSSIKIICGLGNNGGDGLAIGRILYEQGFKVEIFILEYSHKKSADFMGNFARIPQTLPVYHIFEGQIFPDISNEDCIIDAIFGSGLAKPLEGFVAQFVQQLNTSGAVIVAVDIPSGLFMDLPNAENDIIVQAHFTISFQLPKLAFVLPEKAAFVGEWHIIDIGLNSQCIDDAKTSFFYTESIQGLLKSRAKFSNKGNFGHGLIVSGSFGMLGAAILAARAALRTGIGKLTVLVPKCGYEIMQISVPEAMVLVDENLNYISQNIDYQKFNSIGIGPGLGKNEKTVAFLKAFLQNNSLPKVIDADALNIIAEHQFQYLLSPNTIITPHPKEFERLIGKIWKNDFEKLELAREFAKQYQIIVVLKGAHSAVVLPNGQVHFNSTGNAGMAKGGSGDVLTGMITSLLAQGYLAEEAAIIGVYLHGKAGDLAAAQKGQNAMIASDIIEAINF